MFYCSTYSGGTEAGLPHPLYIEGILYLKQEYFSIFQMCILKMINIIFLRSFWSSCKEIGLVNNSDSTKYYFLFIYGPTQQP
jgi:hypothetical protein